MTKTDRLRHQGSPCFDRTIMAKNVDSHLNGKQSRQLYANVNRKESNALILLTGSLSLEHSDQQRLPVPKSRLF